MKEHKSTKIKTNIRKEDLTVRKKANTANMRHITRINIKVRKMVTIIKTNIQIGKQIVRTKAPMKHITRVNMKDGKMAINKNTMKEKKTNDTKVNMKKKTNNINKEKQRNITRSMIKEYKSTKVKTNTKVIRRKHKFLTQKNQKGTAHVGRSLKIVAPIIKKNKKTAITEQNATPRKGRPVMRRNANF